MKYEASTCKHFITLLLSNSYNHLSYDTTGTLKAHSLRYKVNSLLY